MGQSSSLSQKLAGRFRRSNKHGRQITTQSNSVGMQVGQIAALRRQVEMVDVFDALTSCRLYQQKITFETLVLEGRASDLLASG